jgi:arsenite-transporting ATPase
MNPFLQPTRHLFFTGKGGVGKTALSCAAAISLADRGRRVLLVSTDPASNLGEMLGVALGPTPTAVPGVPGLSAMNIDPEAAAEAYRERVLAPYRSEKSAEELTRMREQLSGACTTEIAAFDQFAGLVAGSDGPEVEHVVFDTAPSGHTLRLLALPRAWSQFLDTNTRGASCLGPHSGLTLRHERFAAAQQALANPALTTIVLVARPEPSALREAERSSGELRALGIGNQQLVVNGVFRATLADDPVATAFERRGAVALAELPAGLGELPRFEVPLAGFDMVGLPALRALLSDTPPAAPSAPPGPSMELPTLAALVDELSRSQKGLILVMGKGGVGKTTLAAAIALGLTARGARVHLSTTDPAAHVSAALGGASEGLEVSRIDPRAETEAYTARVLERKGRDLDAEGKALLAEDLRSPCTEEVAVFHAFSKLVSEAARGLVVLDTAPTGHTLLLLDATGAYHRDVLRGVSADFAGRLTTPLMRLRDPEYTKILIVTLAETTPVSEAAALQADLRRAGIEPFAWIVNGSLAATPSADPLLRHRAAGERAQLERVRRDHARRLAVVPWKLEPPVGRERLLELTEGAAR